MTAQRHLFHPDSLSKLFNVEKISLSGGGAVVQLVSPPSYLCPPPLSIHPPTPVSGIWPLHICRTELTWHPECKSWSEQRLFLLLAWIRRREAVGTGEGLSSQVENIACVIRGLIAWVLWGIQGEKLEERARLHTKAPQNSGELLSPVVFDTVFVHLYPRACDSHMPCNGSMEGPLTAMLFMNRT